MKTRIVISILLILVANIIVVAGCTSGSGSNEPLEYIEEGFLGGYSDGYRRYMIGIKSNKVEFEVNDMELEIYHGTTYDSAKEPLPYNLGYLVTVRNKPNIKTKYNFYEDIFNSNDFYILKEVLGENRSEYYFEEKRIGVLNYKIIYNKYDNIKIPKEIFEDDLEENDNNKIYISIFAILWDEELNEFELHEGSKRILTYNVIDENKIRFINSL